MQACAMQFVLVVANDIKELSSDLAVREGVKVSSCKVSRFHCFDVSRLQDFKASRFQCFTVARI